METLAGVGHPTRYWHAVEDGRIQCDVCPKECRLKEGQLGHCFVRGRAGDAIVLTTYGRSSGFCVDPIEKKPLNHFLPGSSVLSFGTAGCNLACRFCQNWDISKSREIDTLADSASPERIADSAAALGCRSVAFTYNDPVVFMEYAIDVAQACREQGIKSVAVTAGYMSPAPRAEFYQYMDAANVDLKAFTEDFYQKICGARLGPVLETLEYLVKETSVWFEITTLLIPGLNDSDEEIDAMTRWIADHLGPDVPLHFTAFHPDWKMRDRPATPTAHAPARASDRARERVALGLHGKRPRPRRTEHGLPVLREDPHRTRRLRDSRLGPRRGRPVPRAAAPSCPGSLRGIPRILGRAQAARHPQGAMTPHRVRTPAVAGTFYPARPARAGADGRRSARGRAHPGRCAVARRPRRPARGLRLLGPRRGDGVRPADAARPPRSRASSLSGRCTTSRSAARPFPPRSPGRRLSARCRSIPPSVSGPWRAVRRSTTGRMRPSTRSKCSSRSCSGSSAKGSPSCPSRSRSMSAAGDGRSHRRVLRRGRHARPREHRPQPLPRLSRRPAGSTGTRRETVVARNAAALGEGDACGIFALRGLVELARRKQLPIELLDLRTSADTAGDPERVVGYGAFAVGTGEKRFGLLRR